MKTKKYLTLEEIQHEEKEMLKELINFFKKENINYFVWAGTFLGAVRHKGFIPWDDDIDLAMTRPEYNNFLEYLKNNDTKISENLEVIGFELGNSDFPFLKIINKNIKIEEDEQCDEYLWIDIFPLDATPKDNAKFYKRVAFLNKLFILRRMERKGMKLIATSELKRFIKTIFIKIMKIWKYENYIKFYISYCTKYKYNDFEYVHNNVWSSSPAVWNKKELVNKEFQFEDIKVNGLKDYDAILTRGYGDYMQIPKEEDRATHNFKAWKVR